MKNNIIKIIKKVLGEKKYLSLKKAIFFVYNNFLNSKYKKVKIYTNLFLSKNGRFIEGGPFAGLKYVEDSSGSVYLPKLIGSYESMLHTYLNTVLTDKSISKIIDIGSAEGYYISGLAKYYPDKEFVAFEISNEARQMMINLLKINNQSINIDVRGEATVSDLEEVLDSDSFVLCDIEGAEKQVLNIKNKSAISNVKYMLVELHDMFVRGCKDTVVNTFKETHEIKAIKFTLPEPEKFPFLKNHVSKYDIDVLHTYTTRVYEQEWLFLSRKDTGIKL